MGDIVKFPKFSRSSSSSAERGDAAASRDAAGKKRSKKAGKAMKSGRRSFTSGTLSMAILTEMMRSPALATPSAPGEALLEAGVLAFRRRKNGEPLILLISKTRSKKWGIPKGKLAPHLSFPENAAKEAYEEAGVIGDISPTSIGMFRGRKRSAASPEDRIVEVWVYLLEVTQMLADWPEKQTRKTRWVSCEVAARQLREPVLAHLCLRLAQS
jgi:8-oxo-dGTP pyrophosphatase MutT (NUDIX family)